MIISASRRTDIPAFHGDWFINQIRQGYVEVKNPFNPAQTKRVSLLPEDVECIVFWTKNPESFIDKLSLLKKYPFYFLYTLTPYGNDLEPGLPEKKRLIDTFIRLSLLTGKERVIWRYDPILLSTTIDIQYHIEKFTEIVEILGPYTSRCIISCITLYKKVIRRLNTLQIRKPDEDETGILLSSLSLIAKKNDIEICSCASDIDFSKYGVKAGRCIDNELIGKLNGQLINYKKDKNQRPACGCYESTDIGAYNTCGYKCLYCYANA
jgi:hypothetical protein